MPRSAPPLATVDPAPPDTTRRGTWASPRARWDAYWQSRHPRRERSTLTHRNLYILPTRPGWLFALTLIVLLIASINYQLNLGYLLTFLLAGCGAVSMHMTHRDLRGLSLHMRPPVSAHVGEAVWMEVVIDNPDARPRYGIGLYAGRAKGGAQRVVWTDVPPGSASVVRLGVMAPRRGWVELPRVTVLTRFPFGLFQSWSLWHPATRVLVYPKPETPAAPLPANTLMPSPHPHRATAAQGELDGVRDYQRGDALRQIAWKKSSRTIEATGMLVSRDRDARQRPQWWLDWQQAGGAPGEARLSRLTAWVLLADRSGAAYGLLLPHLELPPDTGDAHRQRCLEALALAPEAH
jgi:uncharacterized protein (DUF58 family)